MYFSKYNLLLDYPGNGVEKYALLNLLSGSFDLVTGQDKKYLDRLASGNTEGIPEGFTGYLLERGYLFDDQAQEQQRLEQESAKFQETMRETATQIMLIPTYQCNLACTYCFQQDMSPQGNLITKEKVDAFFEHLLSRFADEEVPPYITLFGGEPLIGNEPQKEIIAYVAEKCQEIGIELAAVTNGYHLEQYLDILEKAPIKEIQVTVDGPQAVHDLRRPTRGGAGTFEVIMRGVEGALQKGFPINFRAVVDKNNMESLVELAEWVDRKGWLDLGATRFKTQIGRNYELFSCGASQEHLFSQAEIWTAYVALAQEYPILKKFHRPDLKGFGQLVSSGELPQPSFDSCPAGKKEFVYDLNGYIYGCTASCGREEYRLGSFYPQLEYNQQELGLWQERNILNIPECRECAVSFLCGGGCGVVAREKTGRVLTPECRPIKEFWELGLKFYQEEIEELNKGEIA